METELIDIQGLNHDEKKKVLARAGRILREGGLVAFPTETVYGLGGDAMNPEAAARIYQAKGRPSDNPLIAHIAALDQVENLAVDIPEEAWKVMEAFWPGPMTVILHKRDSVPDQTTGGLSTVAIRMPSHPLAKDLILAAGCPVAAPSANRSGRPSPTLAAHVYEDMRGRIPLILDGGPVEIGIESTIIDMTEDVPMILRPGYLSRQAFSNLLGREVILDPAVAARKAAAGTGEGPSERAAKEPAPKAPGMKYRHYAPRGDLILVEGQQDRVVKTINELCLQKTGQGLKVGVIAAEETTALYRADLVRTVGSRQHPETVAAGLYRILREMDDLGCQLIYSESFFEEKMGEAIMNRLMKASGYRILSV